MEGPAAKGLLAAGRAALVAFLNRQGVAAVRIDVRVAVPNAPASSGEAQRVHVAKA
jgi:hypothetical protein